jgi:hypothetical protein
MHNGLALSLLDFLLVTAVLLLTPNDEWMNVTRTSPSEFVPNSGPPYDSSFSHDPTHMKPPLLTSEATPAIERWRSAIQPRDSEDKRSECGEDSDGSSRPTSRLSFHMDAQSTAQHSAYPPGQKVFASLSDSSLSLASHALSLPRRGHGRSRELPLPPTPLSHGPSFARGPPSASSYASHVSPLPHGQHSQDEPPPLPPLPSSSSIVRPVINTSSAFSRPFAESPTSSLHSRSLPIPPTPSSSKPRMPLLPLVPSADSSPPISPISALPGPVLPPPPRRYSLLRTHSHTHLRNASTPYPDSSHDFKVPPNCVASTPSPPLPISAHGPVQHGAINRSLSIRTTDVAPMLSAPSAMTSADTSFASLDADPYDMPPAYSLIDVAHSSSQLQLVNGEMGSR